MNDVARGRVKAFIETEHPEGDIIQVRHTLYSTFSPLSGMRECPLPLSYFPHHNSMDCQAPDQIIKLLSPYKPIVVSRRETTPFLICRDIFHLSIAWVRLKTLFLIQYNLKANVRMKNFC